MPQHEMPNMELMLTDPERVDALFSIWDSLDPSERQRFV
jgi:hypothetical protein